MVLQSKIGSYKMTAKAQQKNLTKDKLPSKLPKKKKNYCDDCLYYWCEKRSIVTFCTMKSKGLFECKSCMAKIIGSFEKELLCTDERLSKKIELIPLPSS